MNDKGTDRRLLHPDPVCHNYVKAQGMNNRQLLRQHSIDMTFLRKKNLCSKVCRNGTSVVMSQGYNNKTKCQSSATLPANKNRKKNSNF